MSAWPFTVAARRGVGGWLADYLNLAKAAEAGWAGPVAWARNFEWEWQGPAAGMVERPARRPDDPRARERADESMAVRSRA